MIETATLLVAVVAVGVALFGITVADRRRFDDRLRAVEAKLAGIVPHHERSNRRQR